MLTRLRWRLTLLVGGRALKDRLAETEELRSMVTELERHILGY